MANQNWRENPNQAKVLAGVLGILCGSLGIHKFVLGYTTSGVIMLLITILTCGVGATIMQIIGLIEGIIYLTTPDEEFVAKYLDKDTPWF